MLSKQLNPFLYSNKDITDIFSLKYLISGQTRVNKLSEKVEGQNKVF